MKGLKFKMVLIAEAGIGRTMKRFYPRNASWIEKPVGRSGIGAGGEPEARRSRREEIAFAKWKKILAKLWAGVVMLEKKKSKEKRSGNIIQKNGK